MHTSSTRQARQQPTKGLTATYVQHSRYCVVISFSRKTSGSFISTFTGKFISTKQQKIYIKKKSEIMWLSSTSSLAAVATTTRTRTLATKKFLLRSLTLSSSLSCRTSIDTSTASTTRTTTALSRLSTTTLTTRTTSTVASNESHVPASANSLIAKLCDTNISILKQKLTLIDLLKTKFGFTKAQELYQTPCPIVGASIGQHIRHSNDHIELIASYKPLLLDDESDTNDTNNNHASNKIRYDVRARGGTDESDIDQAQERIQNIIQLLEETRRTAVATTTMEEGTRHLLQNKEPIIKACFMLSGTDSKEYELTSTIERELGFVVHHAIHHLATVKIIATMKPSSSGGGTVGIVGLSSNELPTDFGRAPSTVNYDNSN